MKILLPDACWKKREYTEEERKAIRARPLAGQETARKRQEAEA